MRRPLPLAALLATATITATAQAGPLPDPAPWVLPVNAFARARPGDWTILEGDAVIAGKTVHQREVIRVGEVAGGVAEVQLFEGAAGYESWFLSFPVDQKRGPDTNLLYDVPWIATGMVKARATCTLGAGKPFPCTRVTYATPDSTVTVLMAPRVRGSGIVSFEVVRGGAPTWSMTTIGYGTAAKVEWGAGPPSPTLEANRDTSDLMIGLRTGSEYATEDVYEGGENADGVPPSVDLRGLTAAGSVDMNLLRRQVKRKVPAMTDCYEQLVTRGGQAREQVDVTFTVDAAGAIGDLATTGSPSLKWCVSENLGDAQLPAALAGAQRVEIIFTFDPGVPKPKKPVKRKLIRKGHPMRGGPDLRGVTITGP